MDSQQTAPERSLVTTQQSGLFPGQLVVQDDTPLWLAWETAKDAWLAEKRQGRRGNNSGLNTAKAYEIALSQFFAFTDTPPWSISQAHAQNWINHLNEEGRAPATVNQKLAALTSFYDFVQRKYVGRHPQTGEEIRLWPADRINPFNAVDRYTVNPFGRAKFPTDDELQAILDSINTDSTTGLRDYALLYTYAVTCRRDSEIRNLKWGDIQERGDGQYTFTYRYKGGDQRTSVLPAWCFQAIVQYLKAADRWPLEDDEYVFTALDPERILRLNPDLDVDPDAPITNNTANSILKKYARRADVDESKAHLHGLRHAGARLRWKLAKETNTADILEISSILGHSNIAVTQIYTQQILEDPEDPTGDLAAQALARRPRKRDQKPPPPEQGKLL